MKSLVICVAVLFLGLYGPQQQGNSAFDALWGLGVLLTLALVGHRGARQLGLPPMVGSLAAGLVAGRSGLQAIQPTDALLYPAFLCVALWLGFKTGLQARWRPTAVWWPVPAAAALSTGAVLILVTPAAHLGIGLPWPLALFLGAWAALWCPFTALEANPRPSESLFGLLGAASGILFLSLVLAGLTWQGFFSGQALVFVGSLWLSLGLGAAWGGLVWLSRLLRSPETAATVLCGGFAISGLILQQTPLFALPAGLAAGLVLSRHPNLPKYLHALFEPGPPMASILFFALVGASVDLAILWPMPQPVWYAVLVHLLILALLRGAGPALWPLRWREATSLETYSGWLVLPKAALLFELVYHPKISLVGLLPGEWALLFKQVVVAEIVLYGLIAVGTAAFVQWRHPRPTSRVPPVAQQSFP